MSKSEHPSVAIIIVNHNGIEDTTECILSLQNTSYPNYSVIIIDNCDTPEQYYKLKDLYQELEIIRTVNNGFAAANNIGIQKALESKSEFVLILNNDTTVDSNFFKNILQRRHESEVGIFTPKINFYYNKEIIWSAGGRISNIKADAYDYHYNEPSEYLTTDKYVQFATGCCMLVRSELFREVGLLDEKFFLYLEDTEFCKRITDAGYKILFVSPAIVYHKVSSSFNKKDKSLAIYYHVRNRLYFAKLHYPQRFLFIKAYIYLASIKLRIEMRLSGDKDKITFIREGFNDFNKNKMGRREKEF